MESTNYNDLAALDRIVQGQAERNVKENSLSQYLGRCNSMFTLLYQNRALRVEAFEHDEDGNVLKHTGQAEKLFKLRLPMNVSTAKYLFAMISINPNLVKKKKRNREEAEIDNDADIDPAINITTLDPDIDPAINITNIDPDSADNNVEGSTNPAAKIVTVTAQTYQNYKSALKWWHAYDCPDMDKIGYAWPTEIDEALKKAIASYKRDIAEKKRRGIMRNKEGKYPYDLNGYIELNRHFNMIKPEGIFKTWSEGIFAGLFTDLSVHTIGRSDNIDDVLFTNMSWDNDALTITFGRYKP